MKKKYRLTSIAAKQWIGYWKKDNQFEPVPDLLFTDYSTVPCFLTTIENAKFDFHTMKAKRILPKMTNP